MFQFEIERHIPQFIRNDKNGYALAKAIEAAMQYCNDKLQEGLDCIAKTETMPEWRLDELAWEYCLDWYDYDATLAEKRQQIASAIETYRHLGTPGMVRSAVASIKGSASVEEWYDYDGDPFHFRVYANGESISPESHKRLLDMIGKTKNLRSVLDGIAYTGNSPPAEAWALTAAVGVEAEVYGWAGLPEAELQSEEEQ